MKRLCALLLWPSVAVSAPFDRPTPMPQSATAEHWFALASLALVVALYAVHRIVRAR